MFYTVLGAVSSSVGIANFCLLVEQNSLNRSEQTFAYLMIWPKTTCVTSKFNSDRKGEIPAKINADRKTIVTF
jgi:hypothetical protein